MSPGAEQRVLVALVPVPSMGGTSPGMLSPAQACCQEHSRSQVSCQERLLSPTCHFISDVLSKNLSVLRHSRGSRQGDSRAWGGRRKVTVSLFCHQQPKCICTTWSNLHLKNSLTVCSLHPWLCMCPRSSLYFSFQPFIFMPADVKLAFRPKNSYSLPMWSVICLYRALTHCQPIRCSPVRAASCTSGSPLLDHPSNCTLALQFLINLSLWILVSLMLSLPHTG